MATLEGGQASYFWQGIHASRPDPTNVAPLTVCRAFETDTQTWWAWNGSKWLLEDAYPTTVVGGQSTAQHACNIAGYLAIDILKQSLQQAIDAINYNKSVLSFGVSFIGLIPGADIVAGMMLGLYTLYNTIAGGTLTDYTDALADPSLFSRLTCAIYSAIEADGQVTEANFTALVAKI